MGVAVFYFFYFCSTGTMVPYLPRYLDQLGMSGKQIAFVSALGPLITIFAPPVWGLLADRTGRTRLLMRISAWGAAAAFALILLVVNFPAVAAVMAFFAVFSTTITALADTVAVEEARKAGVEYARIRLWGSVGFIIASSLFGLYLSRVGQAQDVIPAVILFLSLCGASAGSGSVSAGPRIVPTVADACRLLAQPDFLLFLLAGMFHWAAMSPYYFCYSLHLKELGIGTEYVGFSFSTGVISEVILMWSFRSLRGRLPLFVMIGTAFLISSARWYLITVLRDPLLLVALQAVHAFSFGAFYVASIAHLERAVPAPLRATGRALYSSVVLGVGGVFGNVLAGFMFERGGPRAAFHASSGLELLAPWLLLAAWYARKSRAVADAPAPPVLGG